MRAMAYPHHFVLIVLMAMVAQQVALTRAAYDIGVCYGMMGDNLPAPSAVVGLYQKYGIQKMRLFAPDPAVLEALKGSKIQVSLGVRNEDIQSLAASQEAANSWYNTNIAPYVNDLVFPYVTVGNEAIPGESAQYIAPAMVNIQNVLTSNKLFGIKVSTVVPSNALGASYPPSAGSFSAEVAASMTAILAFLSKQGSPLMVNVYPYFAYAGDPTHVRLDYAQFTAPGPVVQDGSLSYSNLFDAIVDAFYWAMEKAGVSDVDVAVSESGWPSAGNGNFTTLDLAAVYNKNFMNHVMTSGTPKRPSAHIDAYMFAMFNEDLKPAGAEQNFGFFHPNMEPVYPFF